MLFSGHFQKCLTGVLLDKVLGFRVQGSGFRVQGSGFRVQGCGGGFAANIYGAMPEGLRVGGFPRIASLPHWGRGTASAVDRVLSFIACLRRSFPLFFIPLEPYPARSARHLPHAGKTWIQKYRFTHPTSAPSGHLLP